MKPHRRIAGLFAAGALFVALCATGAPAYASYYRIQNHGSQMCAGVEVWAVGWEGASVVQQSCNGSDLQLWSPVPATTAAYYRFVNKASGKCMDVTNARDADRTPIQQWSCSVSTGMYWNTAVPAYVPTRVKTMLSSGRCLDVRGGSYEEGAVIQLYRCTFNNAAQAWSIH